MGLVWSLEYLSLNPGSVSCYTLISDVIEQCAVLIVGFWEHLALCSTSCHNWSVCLLAGKSPDRRGHTLYALLASYSGLGNSSCSINVCTEQLSHSLGFAVSPACILFLTGFLKTFKNLKVCLQRHSIFSMVLFVKMAQFSI